MAEQPLRQDELKVLRAIIEEHRYQQSRNTFVTRFYSRSRLVVIFVVGLLMLGLQVTAVYYSSLNAHDHGVIQKGNP